MAPLMGLAVVTENRRGATGNLAAEHAARAHPRARRDYSPAAAATASIRRYSLGGWFRRGARLRAGSAGQLGLKPAWRQGARGRLGFDAVRDCTPMVLVSLASNSTVGRASEAGSASPLCATARRWCWSTPPPTLLSAGPQGPARLRRGARLHADGADQLRPQPVVGRAPGARWSGRAERRPAPAPTHSTSPSVAWAPPTT